MFQQSSDSEDSGDYSVHNEDVEEQECVLGGLNICCRYCSTLSMLGRFNLSR